MTDLYLIAHKVRGEPAFDVALRMDCPECESGCAECNQLGHWWIIPTSGHRAYPYYSVDLDLLGEEYNHAIRPGEMPANLPDHYPVNKPIAKQSGPRGTAELLADIGL